MDRHSHSHYPQLQSGMAHGIAVAVEAVAAQAVVDGARVQGRAVCVAAVFVSGHDHVAPIIDVKYQYGISKVYRIEPYVSVKKLEGEVGFGAGINNHFFFRGIKRFRPYGLVGIGYNSMKFTDIQWVVQPIPVESQGLYVRGGLGIDYRFTHQWSMQAELSCDWHIGGGYVFVFIPFKVGVAYNF